ncbi:MAG: hypothetical protein K2N55_01880, partial [Lachnospiraceae bacterium]|nr:hypothetical protein [Lachnospiraceae bacterium]
RSWVYILPDAIIVMGPQSAAAHSIVSSLVFKSDFANRIGYRHLKTDGSEPGGIRAAWLLIRHPCRLPHPVSAAANLVDKNE